MTEYCNLCPRNCGVDRRGGERGFCGCGAEAHVSRISLHRWEEPPISGEKGSGTIFFSGCSLRCVFCQNREISRGEVGRALSPAQLADTMRALGDMGAHNINLVTPTHYLDAVIPALEAVKPTLGIPVVYNCGGYESVGSLKRLRGLVDVYLPDCKYYSSELSARYSGAPDYFEVASRALTEMYGQVGRAVISDGLMTGGLMIRHLVLPGCRRDSIALLSRLAELLPAGEVRLSLMRQFTPEFVSREDYPELCRRITSFEYDSVLREAERLGFTGYSQSLGSESSEFTPDFNTREAFALIDGGQK